MWAIDKPYVKPKHKKPEFADHSKQPKETGHLKKRFAELKTKRKVKEQPKLTFWQKLFKK